ncbi:hypothetical protein [Amorphus orientalis]|uniref:Uncharacterized protein n=1 Tax=Amorphus orientalis TaxID=649198 RepID=A0AAE3VRQ7_9HYPH|nr:hypothetical protein [Amorphus orientalis]MDQ0316957.1 hypothetical protein [Amorphus orientalis]
MPSCPSLRRKCQTGSRARNLAAAAAAAALLALAGCVATPGGPAATACLAPGEVTDRDGDFSRHPELFGPDRCVSQQTFEENGRAWTIQTVRNVTRRGPLWVLPHDDEQAAVATAAYALDRYGGTAVLVETGGRRANAGVDPNRNFGSGRARCTKASSPRFVNAILAERSWGMPVIALHTNAPGIAGRGGSGSVSILAPGPGDQAFRSASASGGLASPDSLVITAVTGALETNRRVQDLVQRLTEAGLNVLVETTSAGRSDCSLSHYAALAGISPYLNLEVRDGDDATQKRMLDIVMTILGYRPASGAS